MKTQHLSAGVLEIWVTDETRYANISPDPSFVNQNNVIL